MSWRESPMPEEEEEGAVSSAATSCSGDSSRQSQFICTTTTTTLLSALALLSITLSRNDVSCIDSLQVLCLAAFLLDDTYTDRYAASTRVEIHPCGREPRPSSVRISQDQVRMPRQRVGPWEGGGLLLLLTDQCQFLNICANEPFSEKKTNFKLSC